MEKIYISDFILPYKRVSLLALSLLPQVTISAVASLATLPRGFVKQFLWLVLTKWSISVELLSSGDGIGWRNGRWSFGVSLTCGWRVHRRGEEVSWEEHAANKMPDYSEFVTKRFVPAMTKIKVLLAEPMMHHVYDVPQMKFRILELQQTIDDGDAQLIIVLDCSKRVCWPVCCAYLFSNSWRQRCDQSEGVRWWQSSGHLRPSSCIGCQWDREASEDRSAEENDWQSADSWMRRTELPAFRGFIIQVSDLSALFVSWCWCSGTSEWQNSSGRN